MKSKSKEREEAGEGEIGALIVGATGRITRDRITAGCRISRGGMHLLRRK